MFKFKTQNEKESEAARKASATVRSYALSNEWDKWCTFTFWDDRERESVKRQMTRVERLWREWGYKYIVVIAPNKEGQGWHAHALLQGDVPEAIPIVPGQCPELHMKTDGQCYKWPPAAHYGIGQHVMQDIGDDEEDREKVAEYIAQNAREAKLQMFAEGAPCRERVVHASRGLQKTRSIAYTIDGYPALLYDNGGRSASLVLPEGSGILEIFEKFLNHDHYVGDDNVCKVRFRGILNELKMAADMFGTRLSYLLPSGKTARVQPTDNNMGYAKVVLNGNEQIVSALQNEYGLETFYDFDCGNGAIYAQLFGYLDDIKAGLEELAATPSII